MLILAVDTSTRSGSVALVRDDALLGQWMAPAVGDYSENLMSAVNELLSRVNSSLAEVELFAVASGPGSFTGLRVGITAVKAWAEVFGRPVAAVSVLEAIASESTAQLVRGTGPTLLAPVLDARRGQVFGGLYSRSGEPSKRLTAIAADVVLSGREFVEHVEHLVSRSGGTAVQFVSPTPAVLVPELSACNVAEADIEGVSPILAPAIALLGYSKASLGETTDGVTLDANYVRRSDAELKWKG